MPSESNHSPGLDAVARGKPADPVSAGNDGLPCAVAVAFAVLTAPPFWATTTNKAPAMLRRWGRDRSERGAHQEPVSDENSLHQNRHPQQRRGEPATARRFRCGPLATAVCSVEGLCPATVHNRKRRSCLASVRPGRHHPLLQEPTQTRKAKGRQVIDRPAVIRMSPLNP